MFCHYSARDLHIQQHTQELEVNYWDQQRVAESYTSLGKGSLCHCLVFWHEMDTLSASLKAFESSLPPMLAAYGFEVVVAIVVATILATIRENLPTRGSLMYYTVFLYLLS